MFKENTAGCSTLALPHALWASGNSLDKLKVKQKLEPRPPDSKSIRPQNPCLQHFLGLAFNKRVGGWHTADVLLARAGYQVTFCKLGTLSCRKTLFLGSKTSGVTQHEKRLKVTHSTHSSQVLMTLKDSECSTNLFLVALTFNVSTGEPPLIFFCLV